MEWVIYLIIYFDYPKSSDADFLKYSNGVVETFGSLEACQKRAHNWTWKQDLRDSEFPDAGRIDAFCLETWRSTVCSGDPDLFSADGCEPKPGAE